MIIRNIKLKNITSSKDISITFSDGFNIICDKNNLNNNTIYLYIKMMLFNTSPILIKNVSKEVDKFTEGSLDFNYNSINYQILRSFIDNNQTFKIINLDQNIEVQKPEILLNNALCELTSNTIDNKLLITSPNITNNDLMSTLNQYILNINTSGDMNIDTVATINYLENQKEEFQHSLKPNANAEYKHQLTNIQKIEKELNTQKTTNLLPDLYSTKLQLENSISTNSEIIQKLKNEANTNASYLNNYDCPTKDSIISLTDEIEHLYEEYAPIQDFDNISIKVIADIIMILIGLILVVIGCLDLISINKNFAHLLNFKNTQHFTLLSDFLYNLPFNPYTLIICIFAIGISLFLIGAIFFTINSQNFKRADIERNLIANVFRHQINTDDVNSETMCLFRKHMNNLLKTYNRLETVNNDILSLQQENNKSIDRLTTIEQDINTQKIIQTKREEKESKLQSIKETNEILKNDIYTNDTITNEIKSIDLAIETLNDLAFQIHKIFGSHLNKKASLYLTGLTEGQYNSLDINDNFDITLKSNNIDVPIDEVDNNTLYYIYLSLRLANIDIIKKENDSLPLFFNNYFSTYNNDNLDFTLKYLYKNVKNQIFIFTSNTKEQGSLNINELPFNLINI